MLVAIEELRNDPAGAGGVRKLTGRPELRLRVGGLAGDIRPQTEADNPGGPGAAEGPRRRALMSAILEASPVNLLRLLRGSIVDARGHILKRYQAARSSVRQERSALARSAFTAAGSF